MTQSVYIIGGAATGKSTFTEQLLTENGGHMGPLVELHAAPNKKNIVTLRGHSLVGQFGEGLYLGLMRDSFPGTDGLDRASSPVGEEWLMTEERLPSYIIGEGATLATERFVTALHRTTDLLLVHLSCDAHVKGIRIAQRGSNQKESFILGTATRSANLAGKLLALGGNVLELETSSEDDWEIGLDICANHLRKSFSASR